MNAFFNVVPSYEETSFRPPSMVTIVLTQSRCTIGFLDNSHISEPALELHSRSAPSVRGITTQSVQPQGEIPEEGRNPGGRQNRKKICPSGIQTRDLSDYLQLEFTTSPVSKTTQPPLLDSIS